MKLPVIRGHVGDWRYYTGVMKFKEIEEIVTPSVDEFCNPSCLNDLLQRQLTENYKSIVSICLAKNRDSLMPLCWLFMMEILSGLK